jgi:hypothetical protein
MLWGMTELNPDTKARIEAEEQVREQVRHEFRQELHEQAIDRRKNVLLYLIPFLILVASLGFTSGWRWPF